VTGPALGGAITLYFHWRWIFLINLPIGVLGFYLVLRHIPNVKEPEMPPLDLAGFALTGVGLSVLMLGLSSLGGHLMPGAITAGCIVLGALALAAYPRHARRTAHPVIDLSLFKQPTFHSGVLAGSLFRIGVGATPFLLPLLLQLGFGMNPLQSGLLTCATAVGAMFMKTLTTMILKRFGFRKVLTVNALVASAAVGVYGLFTAATPHLVIFLVLLVSGCLRSLQFTSLQAISFSEVTRETMSQASSIASMAQRLAQSLGVAIGAYALQLVGLAHGHVDVALADFPPAFVAIALLSSMSLFFHAALPARAGAEVSGHGRGR
jgi:MFS family permease